MLSDSDLVDRRGRRESLCKQCQGFLKIGLPALSTKLAATKKKVEKKVESEDPSPPAPSAGPPRFVRNSETAGFAPTTAKSSAKESSKKRRASNIELELYTHRSLVVSRYIDGFVKGLEVAGLDRTHLDAEAAEAINVLLGISQKLASERLNASTNRMTRSEVRRLIRHIDGTSMMVDEYVRAVSDACRHIVSA